jgi:hypothetical protein
MTIVDLSVILLINLLSAKGPDQSQISQDNVLSTSLQDTIDVQTLYNGRVWRNLYSKVVGNQFLFTTDFMPGSVKIGDHIFNDLTLKYDIFNDQILTVTDLRIIIQLNKEMIDRFTVSYNNKDYEFLRLVPDSLESLSGYFNILYEGNLSLYLKYRKQILPLEVEHKYDLFDESQKIYLKKDGKIYLVRSKGALLNILKDKKQKIRAFIKTNRLSMSKKDPWSLVPIVRYYDSQ